MESTPGCTEMLYVVSQWSVSYLGVVVSGVVVVINGVIVDTSVVVDSVHVVNCQIPQYNLVVVTAGCRRSNGAAASAKQR